MAYLEGIVSTSPQRQILWAAQDSSGNQELDENGQPVQVELLPQIVVEERGIDQLRLTQHPVEQGAAITDHAYKLPAQVQIRASWSFGAQPGANAPGGVATDPSFLSSIYDVLLGLQVNRQFVSLVTGKRTYQNMLLETLALTTDERSENVLNIVANFQEILIATTQTITVPAASVMKNAPSNAAPSPQGQTSALPGSAANIASVNGRMPQWQGSSP